MTHLSNMDTPGRVENVKGYARDSWLVARGSWLVARGLQAKTKPPGLIVPAACKDAVTTASVYNISLGCTAPRAMCIPARWGIRS
jgi:hypothetical protein